jgi:hypothetical protein
MARRRKQPENQFQHTVLEQPCALNINEILRGYVRAQQEFRRKQESGPAESGKIKEQHSDERSQREPKSANHHR